MPTTTIAATASLMLALTFTGCSKDEPARGGADAAAASSAAPVASTPATAASASAPAATAAALPPRSDCPAGSSGPGTFDKPCEGKGAVRQMEATWTGKTTDQGPQFRVTNKTSSVILYGKVTAYFYDKSGKQLEVKDSSGKTHPSQGCGGNIFGGVMKAGEKAVLTFSCLKKDHVPEGTAAIEAEIPMVGFSDASEKKSEFYWRNDELAPETRKKGGVK